MTEIDIQREIRKYLETLGYLVFRMNAGRGRGTQKLCPPGTPDLLAIGRLGCNIWIEVKMPGKNRTPVQERMADDLYARGQSVILARSVKDVQDALRS